MTMGGRLNSASALAGRAKNRNKIEMRCNAFLLGMKSWRAIGLATPKRRSPLRDSTGFAPDFPRTRTVESLELMTVNIRSQLISRRVSAKFRSMMKAILGFFAVVIVFIVLVLGWGVSVNNRLVTLQENVNSKWSQVENVYQRRADLIPNLVNTVKGYAKHEATVLTEVTQARASVGQVHVDNPDDLKKFDQAQGQLGNALS